MSNINAPQLPPLGQSDLSATRASRVMDTITKVALAVLAAGACMAFFTGMPLEALIISTVAIGLVLTPVFYTCFPRPLLFPRRFTFDTPFRFSVKVLRGVGSRRTRVTGQTRGRFGVGREPATPPNPDRFRGKRGPVGGRKFPTRRPPGPTDNRVQVETRRRR